MWPRALPAVAITRPHRDVSSCHSFSAPHRVAWACHGLEGPSPGLGRGVAGATSLPRPVTTLSPSGKQSTGSHLLIKYSTFSRAWAPWVCERPVHCLTGPRALWLARRRQDDRQIVRLERDPAPLTPSTAMAAAEGQRHAAHAWPRRA